MATKKNIFKEASTYFKQKHGNLLKINDITCRFDRELACYAFYNHDENQELDSLVYVTEQYLNNHHDIESLEKTVKEYLSKKKGMQATFKTSGIDEMPLVKRGSI